MLVDFYFALRLDSHQGAVDIKFWVLPRLGGGEQLQVHHVFHDHYTFRIASLSSNR